MRALLIILLFTFAWAQDFPFSAVQPGLTGYARTAVEGNELIDLPLTVIAIQEAQVAGEPLILVQLSGERAALYGGVAAGMSGSPVYTQIEGQERLIGAIGYTFPESDGLYGFVTPVAVMRAGAAGGSTGHGATVLLSGSARSVAVLENEFGPLTVQQLGAARTPARAPETVPGSAVAVSLATGDVVIAAIGTVTAIDDTEVLMFGHPLLALGDASYALQPASITAIIPSRNVPFKLGNIHDDIIGTVHRDVAGGLIGTLGQQPNHIPVHVRVHGSHGEFRYDVHVINDERVSAPVLHAALVELFDRTLGHPQGGSAQLEWDIALSGYNDSVHMRELAASSADIASLAAQYGATPLALLAWNEFRDFEIDRITLDITFEPTVAVARVAKIVLPTEPLTPGVTATINVRFQPYRQEAVVRSIDIQLPSDVTGELTLVARGGSVPRPEHLDDEPNPITRDFAPQSFGEYLTALGDHVESSEFIIEYEEAPSEWRRLARVSLPFAVNTADEITLELVSQEDEP